MISIWKITRDTFLNEPFWNVPKSPQALWVQGKKKSFAILKTLPQQGVSFVGTRFPTPTRKNQLRQWIHALKHSSLVIVSGFATGIDTCAHQAALEANLPTVAVLGCGLQVPYPASLIHFKKQFLAQGGLLITQWPPHTRPQPYFFLQRNRLIAAWTQAVVVVQATEKSGALNTAWWAEQIEHPIFAVPTEPQSLFDRGNQRLLESHFAQPFWGAHSLGSVWLDLATLPIAESFPLKRPPKKRHLVPFLNFLNHLWNLQTSFSFQMLSSLFSETQDLKTIQSFFQKALQLQLICSVNQNKYQINQAFLKKWLQKHDLVH